MRAVSGDGVWRGLLIGTGSSASVSRFRELVQTQRSLSLLEPCPLDEASSSAARDDLVPRGGAFSIVGPRWPCPQDEALSVQLSEVSHWRAVSVSMDDRLASSRHRLAKSRAASVCGATAVASGPAPRAGLALHFPPVSEHRACFGSSARVPPTRASSDGGTGCSSVSLGRAHSTSSSRSLRRSELLLCRAVRVPLLVGCFEIAVVVVS